jgi:hypothetical protein
MATETPELYWSRQAATVYVEGLPRRTAHALHGLLESSGQLNMPVTAAEAQVYDGEAYTARQTAAGLRHAHRLGLVAYTGRYWCPLNGAYDLRRALEDRYLCDTDDGTAL